jgi:muramoyltetrapeptide carboxypeptidase
VAKSPRKPLHIGIIAPGSAITNTDADREAREKSAAGLDYLHNLGYKTTLAKNIHLDKANGLSTSLDTDGLNTAGSVTERLEAIHEIYSNSEIDIVLALRGGYGCIQLLEHLDYKLIKRAKKPLLGYSDLTAFFMAFAAKAKLRSYHCPMLSELSTMPALSAGSFKDLLTMLSESKSMPKLKDFEQNPVSMRLPRGARILGGNLSLIAALAGTKYLPKFRGAYVLLEDVSEPAYKIDRMLEQLRLAGVFKGAKGIMIGVSRDMEFPTRVLDEIARAEGIPFIKNIQVGHGILNVSVPIN